MSEIDFLTGLPPFPRDAGSQVMWFDQLKTMLNNLDAQVDSALAEAVILSQTTEPTQAQWETAYTNQTGKAVPIPIATLLFWWDSDADVFGGYYGTIDSSGTVYPRSSNRQPGAIQFLGYNYLDSTISVTSIIGENPINFPTVTFTINRPMYLTMLFQTATTLTAGSGNWGADFQISGQKVGTLYTTIASNRGLVERSGTGVLTLEFTTPTVLDAGEYTVQVMFGRCNGTTPTVQLDGVRQLLVKGVVA